MCLICRVALLWQILKKEVLELIQEAIEFHLEGVREDMTRPFLDLPPALNTSRSGPRKRLHRHREMMFLK
jgi:hypothetical protein